MKLADAHLFTRMKRWMLVQEFRYIRCGICFRAYEKCTCVAEGKR